MGKRPRSHDSFGAILKRVDMVQDEADRFVFSYTVVMRGLCGRFGSRLRGRR